LPVSISYISRSFFHLAAIKQEIDTGNVKQKARQEGTYEARGAHIFKIAVELLKLAWPFV
jgi:hypothetical protein